MEFDGKQIQIGDHVSCYDSLDREGVVVYIEHTGELLIKVDRHDQGWQANQLSLSDLAKFGVSPSDYCWWVFQSTITDHKSSTDHKFGFARKETPPLSCLHCQTFYPYAEPNREDGRLLCYSCRQDYGWLYG